MADFTQDKKYKYNWQSSKFKDLALSGSYISQFINDAGYVTSSVAISASYALTASYLTGTIASASYAVSSSYALTSSYSSNALTASYVVSASYAPSSPPFPYTGSARITGSLGVTGSISLKAYTGSADAVMNILSISNSQLVKIGGDGAVSLGTYTNPSTQLSINSSLNYGLYAAGLTAIYAQNQTGTGTRYGIQVLGRQYGSVTPSGYVVYGILTGADTTLGINYGLKSYAYNGEINYAGYFDAASGTNNYAIVTQRGFSGFGKIDPTAMVDIKSAGALSSDIALRVRNSADTSNILSVAGDGIIIASSISSSFTGSLQGTSSFSITASYIDGGTF
jgi:hypothetical protein